MNLKRLVILMLLGVVSINANAEVFSNPSLGRTSIGFTDNQIERNFICSALTGRRSVATGYASGDKYGRLVNNNTQLQAFQYLEAELRVSMSGRFNFKESTTAKIFTKIECVDSQLQADLNAVR